jgi:maltose-binding protein MalE
MIINKEVMSCPINDVEEIEREVKNRAVVLAISFTNLY